MTDAFLQIKLIVTDVDGVLTDGKIIFDDRGVESKQFNVKDGMIVKYLHYAGIRVGAITGRDSQVVRTRCEELRLDFHHHGIKDKAGALARELENLGLAWDEVIYIGDDLNDLRLISMAGIGVCPSDAPHYIRSRADLVTHAKGGEGVLREVADKVLEARGDLEQVIEENS